MILTHTAYLPISADLIGIALNPRPSRNGSTGTGQEKLPDKPVVGVVRVPLEADSRYSLERRTERTSDFLNKKLGRSQHILFDRVKRLVLLDAA